MVCGVGASGLVGMYCWSVLGIFAGVLVVCGVGAWVWVDMCGWVVLEVFAGFVIEIVAGDFFFFVAGVVIEVVAGHVHCFPMPGCTYGGLIGNRCWGFLLGWGRA